MNIVTVLSAIGKVETGAGKLYLWLSEKFAHDKEASSLFFRMSMQENSHANLVNYAKRVAHLNPDEFGEVNIDLAVVTDLLEALLVFRRSYPSPTVEQALQFALRVENDAAERVHRSLVIKSNPEIAAIINSLAKADDEHARMLKVFAKKRGIFVT